MQAVNREANVIPIQTIYRNRPSPRLLSPTVESLCNVVYVVDDDRRLYEEVASSFETPRLRVIAFTSASELLRLSGQYRASCVIANSHLPDLCGLELQRELAAHAGPPVIFVSDRIDVPFTVCAMKAGAVDCFSKPFEMSALEAAIEDAFTRDRQLRHRREEMANLQARLCLLTPREREVLPLVIGGLLNKQAASLLGISEVTLQIHRSQVMRKMQANSLADLVRMAVKLRIPHWREARPTLATERIDCSQQ